jgi:hypothetical protein
MKQFLSLILALSCLFPTGLLAEIWYGDNFPIDNFSFEEYDPEINTFDGWEYGDPSMNPEAFDQCLMPSLHYTACAHIKETTIGHDEQSCYLTTEVPVDDSTEKMWQKSCYLVAFVKCSGVSPTTGTGGVFAEVAMTGDVQVFYTSQMLTGEHNWCKLIVPFDFPAETQPPLPATQPIQIRIGLRNATGEVWIDYVQIVPMETAPMDGVCTDLQNPSMDLSPSDFHFQGWTKHPYPLPPNITITADPNNHMNGPISAKFSFSGNPPIEQTAYLYQNISTVDEPRTYYASAFVKTSNLQTSGSANSGAKIHITYPGLDWYSQSVTDSQNWMRIQGTFDKPAVTTPGTLSLRLETTAKAGSAWFDWVTLKLNPVQNPGFNNWSTPSIPPPSPSLRVWELQNLVGNGTGGYTTFCSHSPSSCGKIQNIDDSYDTALTQQLSGDDSPSLREGATYLLTGWIKTAGVTPQELQPGEEENTIPKGAFVDVGVHKDSQFISLVSSEPLVGSTDGWQEFSLCFSLPLDYFIEQTDDLYSMKNDELTTYFPYEIRCRLSKASGTAYFDDVNIVELEPTEDLATVVPQPQAFQSFGYFADPLVSFNPSKIVTIYYTPEIGVSQEDDTYYFSAENLRQELNRAFYECTEDTSGYDADGWEGIKYDFPIPESNVKKLDGTVTLLTKPCIIIGDPTLDGSTGQLFSAELFKRGTALPQHLSAEGYIMQIDEEMILIAASDSGGEGVTKGAGSFYGTETLLQMLDIEQRSEGVITPTPGTTYHPNKVVAPACYIYDYPDMVWRGQMSYMQYLDDSWVDKNPLYHTDDMTGFSQINIGTYGDPDYMNFDNDITKNMKLFAKQMAKFKMNRFQIFSTIFFFLNYNIAHTPYDDDDLRSTNHYYIASLFDYCRKLHIEPIPMLGDWVNALLRHNGNCLECSIFDSQYIEDNDLVPKLGDYYYTGPTEGINQYPYPMPQPSWEFTLEKENTDGMQYPRYYFADNTVNLWIKGGLGGGSYQDVKTMDYRVYNDTDFPVTVEVWNEQENKWDLLTSGYTLHNVGLNDTSHSHVDINTSYFRFVTEDNGGTGFYDHADQDDWAYITFSDDMPEGTQIRVSYAAPINMGLIWPAWADQPMPRWFSPWTCLSYFDQSSPPDPETEDSAENWVTWNSRDIWYVALYQMIGWLNPRYIDVQHCEQWIMHLDKRCQVERKNDNNYPDGEQYGNIPDNHHNAFIYGKEIDWLEKQIESISAQKGTDTQLMLFADMFDSHNGRYAEGRCQWNWYPNDDRQPLHQPDIDDDWVGNVNSHIYYQPAMGGMGGWTWNLSDPGMMASQYVENKENIVCWEWGYQDGYFDDRDPENVILWQDKFEERFRQLGDQGFTKFVGGCAGYALGLEGSPLAWAGVRMKCRDDIPGNDYYAHLQDHTELSQLDGSNLNWVEMEGDIDKLAGEQIDITLLPEAYNDDPSYGAIHLDIDSQSPTVGKGCHLGTIQDGNGYMDDIQVKKDDLSIFTDCNLDFESDFDNNQDPLVDWKPSGYEWDYWTQSDEYKHCGNYCCKVGIDNNGYYYINDDRVWTHVERQLIFPFIPESDYHIYFNVWLKTVKLDALRDINVKNWMDLTYNYQPKEKILGMINTQWGDTRNYSSESTSADWMWSKNYPVSPFIKYLFYDPYYLFLGDKMNDPAFYENPYIYFQPNAPYPTDEESILP